MWRTLYAIWLIHFTADLATIASGLRIAAWCLQANDREGYQDSFLDEIRTFDGVPEFGSPDELRARIEDRLRTFCVVPVASMLGSAVAELPRLAAGILSDPRQRSLLFNSAAIGLGTAARATLVGMPLGFVLARSQLGLTPLWRIALAAPAVLAPYVVALA